MNGLWIEERTLRYRDDLQQPRPAPGEALIRPILVGICATDLELLRGYYPFSGVPGHEFVGEVVEAPTDPSWAGARVVGEINAGCQACETCLRRGPSHCDQRTVLGIVGRDGAFAERFCLPLSNLLRVPDSISDEAAVFVEPLAAALQVQQQLHVRPGARVVLLGAGRLGQLLARTLSLTGCELLVVARHPQQQRLLENVAISSTLSIPAARAADIVIDATGNPDGFDAARAVARPGGTIVLKTTCTGETRLRLAELVVDEVTVIGSRCGPFAAALRLLRSGAVDPRPLISGRFALEDGEKAFAFAANPQILKVLVEPKL